MHTNPDLKVLFTDRPNDPIEVVAADLLDVYNGNKHITDVVDIGAFLDITNDDRLHRMWGYLRNNIHAFQDNFFVNGEINNWFVACEYLTDLLIEHHRDLEMIVALKKE